MIKYLLLNFNKVNWASIKKINNLLLNVLSGYQVAIMHNQKHINLKFKVLQDLTKEERVKAFSSIDEGLDPVITEPVTDCRG